MSGGCACGIYGSDGGERLPHPKEYWRRNCCMQDIASERNDRRAKLVRWIASTKARTCSSSIPMNASTVASVCRNVRPRPSSWIRIRQLKLNGCRSTRPLRPPGRTLRTKRRHRQTPTHGTACPTNSPAISAIGQAGTRTMAWLTSRKAILYEQRCRSGKSGAAGCRSCGLPLSRFRGEMTQAG